MFAYIIYNIFKIIHDLIRITLKNIPIMFILKLINGKKACYNWIY